MRENECILSKMINHFMRNSKYYVRKSLSQMYSAQVYTYQRNLRQGSYVVP